MNTARARRIMFISNNSTITSQLIGATISLLCILLLAGCEKNNPPKLTEKPLKTYHIKLAHSWPNDFPIFSHVPKQMTEMAEKMSGGRLQFTILSAREHGAPLGIFNLVKNGSYEMGHSASYYWKDQIPSAMFFTTVPFGMDAIQQKSWFYHGGGIELMQEAYAPHGLLSFPGGNTGKQMSGWFRKPVNNLSNLKGLKIRIPGFAGNVLKKLGAIPVNLPPHKLYDALEKGEIDAVEWVAPFLDVKLGLPQITSYYYEGWQEPGTELQFLTNQNFWNSLPDDLQEILRVSMMAASSQMLLESNYLNSKGLERIRREYPHVQIKKLPKSILSALKKTVNNVLNTIKNNDPFAKRIIESRQNFHKQIKKWTEQ